MRQVGDDRADVELVVRRAKAGDKEAVGKLYRMMSKVLDHEAQAFSISGKVDPSDYRSLLNEKFLTSVLASYDPDVTSHESFASWLKRTLRLRMSDLYRTEAKRAARDVRGDEAVDDSQQLDSAPDSRWTPDASDGRLQATMYRAAWRVSAFGVFDSDPGFWRSYCRALGDSGRLPVRIANLACGKEDDLRQTGQRFWLFPEHSEDMARAAVSQALFVDGWRLVVAMAAGGTRDTSSAELMLPARLLPKLAQLVRMAAETVG